MFGRIIGKIISTPIRLANVPMKAAAKTMDFMCGKDGTRVRDYDPLALDQVADEVDRACDRDG